MNRTLRAKAEVRLPKLPHSVLVDSLLDLAEKSDSASRLVEALIMTDNEALASFKRKLTGLKRRKRFYHRSQARSLFAEIETMLDLLEHDSLCPREVFTVLVSFFQADSKIMEMADDSNGNLGYLFSVLATQRLARAGALIDDQKFLKKNFKKLYEENGYGVRDSIADHAAEFLSEESLRELYGHYTSGAPECRNQGQARTLAEALSAQLKEPDLYEAEIRKLSEHYFHAKLPELAEIYLKAGREHELVEKMDQWLPLVPSHYKHKLEAIAEEAYAKTNDQERLINSLTEQLLTGACSKAYQALSKILDSEDLSQRINELRENAFRSSSLDLSQIRFFLENGEPDTAEELVSKFSEELDGDLYYTLPDLAKAFDTMEKPLAASLLYRALLSSILERGATTAYSHAAQYLQILEDLAKVISNWESHQEHSAFLKALHEIHYRKTSFWKRVPEEICQAAAEA